MEPLDFEDFLLQHQNAVDRDPMRQLLEYPPDDVTVEMLRRHCRTIAPIIPEHGYVAQNQSQYINNLLHSSYCKARKVHYILAMI